MFRDFSPKSDLLERHTPVLPYTASTPPPPHLDERSDLDAYHTVKNLTYELIIFSALWENDKGPFLFGEITG